MTANEQTKTQVTLPSDCEILVVRTFDSPRQTMWKMWTEAQHLKHWWGPKEWTLPVCEVDLRPGGSWFYCMESPDGNRYCGKAEYVEVDEPLRLIFKDMFTDADGNAQDGMPVSTVTVEFIEENGKTTVRNTTRYETKVDRDKVVEMGVEAGISQTYDRLDEYLLT